MSEETNVPLVIEGKIGEEEINIEIEVAVEFEVHEGTPATRHCPASPAGIEITSMKVFRAEDAFLGAMRPVRLSWFLGRSWEETLPLINKDILWEEL